MSTRRGFITGLVSLAVTAPAIVRAGSLMPVKRMVATDGNIIRYIGFDIIYQTRLDFSPGVLSYVVGDLVAVGERFYRCTKVIQ